MNEVPKITHQSDHDCGTRPTQHVFIYHCFFCTGYLVVLTADALCIVTDRLLIPKRKLRFPGHHISWVSDFSPRASSAMEAHQRNEICTKVAYRGEDDARSSNTRIAPRKRATAMKTHRNTVGRTTALCNQPAKIVSDLGDVTCKGREVGSLLYALREAGVLFAKCSEAKASVPGHQISWMTE